MKIDDKAVVPVGWVFTGFGIIISTTIFGAFWVATVNFRLERIEDRLGIPPYHAFLVPAETILVYEQCSETSKVLSELEKGEFQHAYFSRISSSVQDL